MNLSSVSGIRIKTSTIIVVEGFITIKMVMECTIMVMGYYSIYHLISALLIIPQLNNIIYLIGKRKNGPLRYPITNPSDDLEMEPSVFDISSVQELVRGSSKLDDDINGDSNQFTVFEVGILKVFSSKRTFYLVSAQTASFTIARRSITDDVGVTAPGIDSSEKSILAERHKHSKLQGKRKFRKYCNSHVYSIAFNEVQ